MAITTRDRACQGHLAASDGRPVDTCPYRRPEHKNAWVRGWQQGHAEAQGELVHTPRSPYQQSKGRAAIKAVRAMLSKPARPVIEGEVHRV